MSHQPIVPETYSVQLKDGAVHFEMFDKAGACVARLVMDPFHARRHSYAVGTLADTALQNRAATRSAPTKPKQS